MSRRDRDYHHRQNDRHHHDQDHSRSRDHHDHRDNRDHYDNRERNQRDHRGPHHRNNYQHPNRPYSHYSNRQDGPPVVRSIIPAVVDPPKQFPIGQNTSLLDSSLPKFLVSLSHSEKEPPKKETRLGELKNRITPIQKLWTSHIKQYLNDSQFVEIYRSGKSLSFGEVEYGKSIVKYDGSERKEMVYENNTSQSNVFSRAYFKLWEILELGVLDSKKDEKIAVGCVAEGPGGFIHALIDYRNKQSTHQDDFYSITLKIDENTRNAKDWSDYRGKSHFDSMRRLGYKIKLSYGQTQTGNLLLEENLDFFAEHDLENRKCFLVTGDGGIECIGDKEFDYQEVFNCKLFFGEILAALKINEVGGTFILKIYDCSFELTKQLLGLLCVFYEGVRIVKPITSRPGNSEKYMLCERFVGMSPEEEKELKGLLKGWTEAEPNLSYFQNKQFVQSVLDFSNVKNYPQIIKNIEESNEFFLKEQEAKLEEGLLLSEKHGHSAAKINEELREFRFQEQMSYAYAWCQKYHIACIPVQIEPKKEEERASERKEEGGGGEK